MTQQPIQPRPAQKGVPAILACYVLWGLLPGFWKLFAAMDPFYLLAVRTLWSVVACALLITLRGGWRKVAALRTQKKLCLRLACCSVAIALNWSCYIVAVNSGFVLEASLAYYLNPIVAIALSAAIFREKLRTVQWAAVALALLGVLISLIYYGSVPYRALIIAVSFAIYGALKRDVALDAEVSLFVETLLLLPVVAGYLLYTDLAGLPGAAALPAGRSLLLPLTGVLTALPLLFYGWGVRRVSFSLSGILMYINPTLQLLLAVLVFGEAFTPSSAVTFALVWAALFLFVGSNLRAASLAKRAADAAQEREQAA